MKFIEARGREYRNSRYRSYSIMFALDDIARVIECVDDCDFTNIITKDGKFHTVNERYEAIIKKIKDAGDAE